jgi:beta-ureidopropionase / N-carbamoyl-L-amino-acid hydrolase
MTVSERWKEDLIRLGELGRKVPVRIESQMQLQIDNGLYRLEGTEACIRSKAYVIQRMKAAGLDVRIDRIGNIFGRKEGSKANSGVVMSGSHLDSVLNGGMFDGPLGVVSALEAVRKINDEGFENKRAIEVAGFMGEEGSAFKKALFGSHVLVGAMPIDEALAVRNEEGVPLRAALGKLRGDFEIDLNDVDYFIETHIEQGPILDGEKVPIGIVENITGMSWVQVTLEGQENHAGTTPMAVRKDPLVAGAETVLFVNKRAKEMVKEFGGSTVATVGKMVVTPGAPNIVPGKVEMGIDIRDGSKENMACLRNDIISGIKNLARQHGIKCTIDTAFDHPPVPCSEEVVNAIESAASSLGIETRRMNSGAGHDAQNMAQKVKTAMIFVPSVNGISHSPFEWTHWSDVENGINLLTRSIKTLTGS